MFRFTIRDLLWLTALVAVLAAWRVDHGMLRTVIKAVSRENIRLIREAEQRPASVAPSTASST